MTEQDMVAVVRQIAQQHYGIAHLADVRQALGLDRQTFWTLLQKCRRSGTLTCAGAERCQHRLEEGVREDGLTLLWVSLRE